MTTLSEKVLLPAIVEASARVKLAAPDEKVWPPVKPLFVAVVTLTLVISPVGTVCEPSPSSI